MHFMKFILFSLFIFAATPRLFAEQGMRWHRTSSPKE